MSYTIESRIIDYTGRNTTANKYVIAHESGNPNNVGPNSLEGEVKYMQGQAAQGGAFTSHWVGSGGRIIQIAPVGKIQYGAGGIANPLSYAQVELARTNNADTFKKDYAAYVWLLRKLAAECGIPQTLDKTGNGVKTHLWVTNNLGNTDHTDPYAYLNSFGISNAQFAADIANGITTPVTAPAGVTFAGQAHIQSKGWVEMANNTLGTVGQGLRLEAFSLVVKNNGKVQPLTGSIHVQDVGNVAYNQNTNLFGTVGQEKRLEAILINVGNGVQYRTHVANQGWGAWVSSGQWSGTKEMGLRIEAIEFRVG